MDDGWGEPCVERIDTYENSDIYKRSERHQELPDYYEQITNKTDSTRIYKSIRPVRSSASEEQMAISMANSKLKK